MPPAGRLCPGAAVLAALLLGGAAVGVHDMEVPVGRQVPLLMRVLAFDRSLAGSDPLVVAVVYQEGSRESRRAGDDFEAALRARPARVHGRPVRAVPVALASAADLGRQLRRAGAEAAYLAPLRSVDVGAVARSAAGAGALTLTGVRDYVSDGVAVGVGLRGGRPEILLNPGAAPGADLSARLLQLATIVD